MEILYIKILKINLMLGVVEWRGVIIEKCIWNLNV